MKAPFLKKNVSVPQWNGSVLESIGLDPLVPMEEWSKWSAMTNPVVARSRNLIVSVAVETRLDLVIDGMVQEHRPRNLRVLDARYGYSASISMIIDSLLFYGYCALLPTQDSIYVVDPLQVNFDENGTWSVIGGYPQSSYIMIWSWSPGVLWYGRKVIEHARRIDEALASVAKNPVPTVDLHQTTINPTLTQEDIAGLVASWTKARQSPNGTVAYTPANIEAKMQGQPAQDVLIQGKTASDIDVARIMNVPAVNVDVFVSGGNLFYSTPEARSKDVLQQSVRPYLTCIQKAISEWYPEGTSVVFDTTTIGAGTIGEQATDLQAATEAGIITQDEAIAIAKGRPEE